MNLADLHRTFEERFGAPPSFIVRAPGRVNILGEHVDYNEGLVLPAAIDRAVYLALAPSQDSCVYLHALDLGEQVTFSLECLDAKQDTQGAPLASWARYPAGVAWALQSEGLSTPGLQGVYTSNVPIGAGLSSSAAVEVAFAFGWQTLGGWAIDPLHLAQLCQLAENRYVGVSCGLMDQFSSACGVEDHALLFDTRSLEWQALPLPPKVALVIVDSGQRRDLTSSAYNERRAACEQAVRELQRYLPHLRSLRDISITEFAAYSMFLSEIPRKRAEHVVKEIARVESAVNALRRGDKQALGALMYAGHNSLRTLYEVSTPELDTLVQLTRSLPGCIGARLTGAGFGGCTVNLVEEEYVESFIRGLTEEYVRLTGRQATAYRCRASRGVSLL